MAKRENTGERGESESGKGKGKVCRTSDRKGGRQKAIGRLDGVGCDYDSLRFFPSPHNLPSFPLSLCHGDEKSTTFLPVNIS